MFTGIVETQGRLESKKTKGKVVRLRFAASGIQNGMKVGDSLSTNGVCLTVVDFDPDFVEMDVMRTTLKVTALGRLKRGDRVNFERSLRVSDRLDGHWVQGHVDGVGTVIRKVKKGRNVEFHIKADPELISQLVPKGSVTVDGISLTIQSLDDHSFSVGIIPHTLEVTNMGSLRVGSRVNLEVDILSKYVRKSVREILSDV